MKNITKRILVAVMALCMLLGSACSAVPADVINGEQEVADGIISSSDISLTANTTATSAIKNIVATEYAYVRGGKNWADKNWRKINSELIASGQIATDIFSIKNGGGDGMQNNEVTRVGLFKYDISGLTLEDIGYATFEVNFTEMDRSIDLSFDIYWVEDNWSESTVTWNTIPAMIDVEPIVDDVPAIATTKANATYALKALVASGKKTISLMVVQNQVSNAETRLTLSKTTDTSFPYFTVYKDPGAKNNSYIKQLVSDEAENKAIWDHAKQMFDEWYTRYEKLKNTPLVKADLIVSDQSQYNKTNTSPGSNPNGAWKTYKSRTYSDLTDMSKFVDVTAEVRFDKYGGIIDEQLRQENTGFYYTKKIGDRWWIIDPLGYPCYIRALSGVVYSYQNSPKQKEAATKLFGDFDKWALATTRHLVDDLYFNAAASPSNQVTTVVDGMAIQKSVGFIGAYGTSIGINNSNGGSSTFTENNTMPVFDPAFVTFADEKAKTIETNGWANDRTILGFTFDNELPMEKEMIYNYMGISPIKPVNHYSYACTWYWLTQMTGKENPTAADITEELEQLFRGFIWDRYYYVVTNAVRKYDPNHMLLGTRFLTVVKDAPWVLRFAGEYLDCITVNWYGQWEPNAEDIYDFAVNANVPFMVTEFYAKAQENEDNLANTTGAGFYVKTQQDRADHYQSFTLRLLEAKNCVGWHWFQYSDNDPTGNPTDVSSIDANKGIVSNTHTEYTDLTDDMADINKNVYTIIKYFDTKYAK